MAPGTGTPARGETLALALLWVVPVTFTSNMLAARFAADHGVPPAAISLWRWLIAAALLAPFVWRQVWRERAEIRRQWHVLLVLGFLGMGVCGAVVYLAAQTTTVTNIGLIYAMSPVLIVVFAGLLGERLVLRQGVGVALCLIGVGAVIFKGDAGALLRLEFVIGDLWVLCTSIAWAIYTLILRHRPSRMAPLPHLFVVALFGLCVLIPLTAIEHAAGDVMAFNATTLGLAVFLALVPGIGAYGMYAFMASRLGASRTGVVLYLTPLYAGLFAWVVFGEAPQWYHLAGAALVLPGIYLATRKPGARRARG